MSMLGDDADNVIQFGDDVTMIHCDAKENEDDRSDASKCGRMFLGGSWGGRQFAAWLPNGGQRHLGSSESDQQQNSYLDLFV